MPTTRIPNQSGIRQLPTPGYSVPATRTSPKPPTTISPTVVNVNSDSNTYEMTNSGNQNTRNNRYSDIYQYLRPKEFEYIEEQQRHFDPYDRLSGDYPKYQSAMKRYGKHGERLFKYGYPLALPYYYSEGEIPFANFPANMEKYQRVQDIKKQISQLPKESIKRQALEAQLTPETIKEANKQLNLRQITEKTPFGKYFYNNNIEFRKDVKDATTAKLQSLYANHIYPHVQLGSQLTDPLFNGIGNTVAKFPKFASAIPLASLTLGHASALRSNLHFQRDKQQYGKWGTAAQVGRSLTTARNMLALAPAIATAMGNPAGALSLTRGIGRGIGHATGFGLSAGGLGLRGLGNLATGIGHVVPGAGLVGSTLHGAGTALGGLSNIGLPGLSLLGAVLPSLFSVATSIRASARRMKLYGKKIPSRADIQKYTVADRYDPVIAALSTTGELKPFEQLNLALQRDHSQLLANIVSRMDLKEDSTGKNLKSGNDVYKDMIQRGKHPTGFIDRQLGRVQKFMFLANPMAQLWTLLSEGKTPKTRLEEYDEAYGLGKHSKKEKKKVFLRMKMTSSESNLASFRASDIANLTEDCCSKQVSLLTYLGDLTKEIWLNIRAIRICGFKIPDVKNLSQCKTPNPRNNNEQGNIVSRILSRTSGLLGHIPGVSTIEALLSIIPKLPGSRIIGRTAGNSLQHIGNLLFGNIHGNTETSRTSLLSHYRNSRSAGNTIGSAVGQTLNYAGTNLQNHLLNILGLGDNGPTIFSRFRTGARNSLNNLQNAISEGIIKNQRSMFAGLVGGTEKRDFFERNGLLISDDQKKSQILTILPRKLGEIIKYENGQLEVLQNIYDVLQLIYSTSTGNKHEYQEREPIASEYNVTNGMYLTEEQMSKVAKLRGFKAKSAFKKEQLNKDKRFFGLSGLYRQFKGKDAKQSIEDKLGTKLANSEDMASLYQQYILDPSAFESELRYQEGYKKEIERRISNYKRGGLYKLTNRKKIVSELTDEDKKPTAFEIGSINPSELQTKKSKFKFTTVPETNQLPITQPSIPNISLPDNISQHTISQRIDEEKYSKLFQDVNNISKYTKKTSKNTTSINDSLDLLLKKVNDLKDGFGTKKKEDNKGGMFGLGGIVDIFKNIAEFGLPLVGLFKSLSSPIIGIIDVLGKLNPVIATAAGIFGALNDKFAKETTSKDSDSKVTTMDRVAGGLRSAAAATTFGLSEKIVDPSKQFGSWLGTLLPRMTGIVEKTADDKIHINKWKSYFDMDVDKLGQYKNIVDLDDDSRNSLLQLIKLKKENDQTGLQNLYSKLIPSGGGSGFAKGGSPYNELMLRSNYDMPLRDVINSGYVTGSPFSDSVPATLHRDEYVLTKGETSSITGLLKKMTLLLASIRDNTDKNLEQTPKSPSDSINTQVSNYMTSRLDTIKQKQESEIEHQPTIIPVPIPTQQQNPSPNLEKLVNYEKPVDPISSAMIDQIFANTIINLGDAMKQYAFGQTPFAVFK